MKKYNKKFLIAFLIIVIISASFVISQISGAKAEADAKTAAIVPENSEPALTGYNESGSMYPALFKLLGALALIIGLIYGFILLLRKLMGQKISGNRGGSVLEVIETAYVGQKKSVSLVRFSDRAVLIGMGDSNISVLAELSKDDTAKILVGRKTEKKNTGFGQVFNEARRKLTLQISGSGAKMSRMEVEQTGTVNTDR